MCHVCVILLLMLSIHSELRSIVLHNEKVAYLILLYSTAANTVPAYMGRLQVNYENIMLLSLHIASNLLSLESESFHTLYQHNARIF